MYHPFSIQEDIDNDGWLIGRDFFQALIGKDSLYPVYNNFHKIIGFTISSRNKEADEKIQETVFNVIMAEMEKIDSPFIGFKSLKKNAKHPEYSDDFLKRIINNSNEQLRFTKLNDTGDHDTLAILLSKSIVKNKKTTSNKR